MQNTTNFDISEVLLTWRLGFTKQTSADRHLQQKITRLRFFQDFFVVDVGFYVFVNLFIKEGKFLRKRIMCYQNGHEKIINVLKSLNQVHTLLTVLKIAQIGANQ